MFPTTWPDPSRIGAAAIETATSVPSLRCRTVSKSFSDSPARTRVNSASLSARRDSGAIGSPPRPTISSRVQPKMRSAAGFHSRTRVSRSNSTRASGDESINACSRASCRFATEMSL